MHRIRNGHGGIGNAQCTVGGEPPLDVGWAGLSVNTGILDRCVRATVAVTLLFVAWSTPVLGGDLLIRLLVSLFAMVNLFAVSTGWCAMYCATGVSTVRRRTHGERGHSRAPN